MSAQEVRDVSANLDKQLVPHDVLWLDLDHTDGRKYFTWEPRQFQNPESLQTDLDTVKRKLVILVDPHLKSESSYSVYAAADEKGLLIRNNDGNGNYEAQCWPGKSSWPDFLNPAARAWWETNYDFSKFTSSRSNLHIWNDMNEISAFDGPEGTAPRGVWHIGGIEEREVHNIYGHLMISATFGGLVKRDSAKNSRPFILTRSFFAGSQKYAAAWTGDNAAEWSHLQNSIPMVLSFGIASMVYSGADIGGFFDSPDQALLARWYQVGAWLYPFFRCHCHHLSAHREIYVMTEQNAAVAREAIVDRYMLLPYWYTLARVANLTGEPIVRPVWWEFPENEWTDVEDRAMLGPALFVVPFLSENNALTIEFPASRWFCYRTLGEIKEQTLVVSNNDGRAAVFIRGGTVVPIKRRIRKSSSLMFWDPFSLIVAVGNDGKATGELYIDDGETFDFTRGSFIHRKFVFDGKTLRSVPVGKQAAGKFLLTYDVAIEQIQVTGLQSGPKAVVDSKGNQLKFFVKDGVVTIRKPNLHVKEDFTVSFQY
jgi:alpha 1,3-glucosidase